MTASQSIAYRIRWLLLALACAGMAAWVVFLIDPLFEDGRLEWLGVGLLGVPWFFKDLDKGVYGLVLAGYLGVFLFTQWLFLLPRRNWSPHLAATGRPMMRAVIIAGFMAALLDVGLMAVLIEIPDWYLAVMYKGADVEQPRYWPFLLALALTWTGWTWVLWTYFRSGDRYTWMSRILRGLIAGSILELLVAAPVHALAGSKRDCHCARGSYAALVLGGTVLLWAFGPAVVLLFWREKHRRAKLLQGGEPANP